MVKKKQTKGRHGLPVKSERIIFAVTLAEKAAMKKAAAARGVTITDYLLSLHRKESASDADRNSYWWARAGELHRLAKDVERGRADLPWTPEEIAELKKQVDQVRALSKALAEHVAKGGENSVKERQRIAARILGVKGREGDQR